MTTTTKLANWDHTVPRSILSDYELRCVAHGISSALHYTTGIRQCDGHNGALCAMYGNAMRLVIQDAEPRIRNAMLTAMSRAVGVPNIDLAPRCADDFG